MVEMLKDDRFTLQKYEILSKRQGSQKVTYRQITSFSSILRWIVVNKYGVQALNLETKVVHKLLIVGGVLSMFESDKNAEEEMKKKLTRQTMPVMSLSGIPRR